MFGKGAGAVTWQISPELRPDVFIKGRFDRPDKPMEGLGLLPCGMLREVLKHLFPQPFGYFYLNAPSGKTSIADIPSAPPLQCRFQAFLRIEPCPVERIDDPYFDLVTSAADVNPFLLSTAAVDRHDLTTPLRNPGPREFIEPVASDMKRPVSRLFYSFECCEGVLIRSDCIGDIRGAGLDAPAVRGDNGN